MDFLDLRHRLSLAFSTGATSAPSTELSPAVYAGAAAAALGVGGLLFWAMRKPADPRRAERDRYYEGMKARALDNRTNMLSMLGLYYDTRLPPGASPKKVDSAMQSNVHVRVPGRPYVSVVTEDNGAISAMFDPTDEHHSSDEGIYRSYGSLLDALRELKAYEAGGYEEIAKRERRDKAKWST